MPRALSRQQQRSLAGRKTAGSPFFGASSGEKWLRNPLIWLASLLVLGVISFISTDQGSYYSTLDASYLKGTAALLEGISSMGGAAAAPAPPFDLAKNTQQIQEWRSQTESECRNVMSTNNGKDTPAARAAKEQAERDAISKLQFPSSVSGSRPVDHQPYQYCRNVFIDLGTNIGDSIGYFIDSAMDVCSPIWMESLPRTKLNADFPRPHLDVSTLEMLHKGAGNNPLYGMLQNQMIKNDPHVVTPNSFCVYGMEGNPAFTERLQKLENHVMQTQPRPVQHLHIHTESVVTAVDGPTKLFLDKTSVEKNFWGSSILSSQQDAVKSAKELGDGQVFSADVQGISLSTLTKSSVLAYKPGASPEETKGGLLIIKMDVEGAEYQVLKEVATSGVLCDYISKGNRVVMIVEFHNMSITDANERRREKAGANEAKATLSACGVEFGTLHAHWA